MKRRICAVLLAVLLLAQPCRASARAEASKTAALAQLFTTVDLMDASIAELLAAMDDGRLTSERLVQLYLDRIAAYDKPLGLNSVLSLNENALDEARAADEKRAAGESGRLLGIPILIKDNIDVAGMATTCGSYSRLYAVAAEDADVVARLRAEGAVILGKTNLSLFAASGADSVSEIAGAVSNPYDLARTPAGSSGGSAVAVTCNFCAAALGTDTGSSLRRPASFANIYSLRPSLDTVSLTGLYVQNIAQDIIGPMCRSVADMALLYDIMSMEEQAISLNADALAGKRIGYLANSFGYVSSLSDGTRLREPTLSDRKILALILDAVETLRACGAELIDLAEALPDADFAYYDYTASDYTRRQLRERLNACMAENDIDAIIYVSQTDVADLQTEAWGQHDNEASYINILSPIGGLPEVMLPMGFAETDAENGYDAALPLGLSMLAPYGADAELLSMAYAYEQAVSVREQPSTTPALPDAALDAFAAALLRDSDALNVEMCGIEVSEEFAESRAALADMTPSTEGGDAAAYQAAVARLAEAYDACNAQRAAVAERDALAAENAPAPAALLPDEPTEAETSASTPRLRLNAPSLLASAALVSLFAISLRRRRPRRP